MHAMACKGMAGTHIHIHTHYHTCQTKNAKNQMQGKCIWATGRQPCPGGNKINGMENKYMVIRRVREGKLRKLAGMGLEGGSSTEKRNLSQEVEGKFNREPIHVIRR